MTGEHSSCLVFRCRSQNAERMRVSDLQSSDGCRLEAQIGLEVLSDLAHQTLERQLADQQLGRLLVATNLAQSNRA